MSNIGSLNFEVILAIIPISFNFLDIRAKWSFQDKYRPTGHL